MAWSWKFEKADGAPVEPEEVSGATFTSRADAETWIGEEYADLVDEGVDQVRLFEEEREVYGPMSLHP